MLWAPVNVMVRMAATAGFSPLALGALRWWAVGLVLSALLRVPAFRKASRAKAPTRSEALQAALFGAILFAPAHVIYYLAIGMTSTVEATVLGTVSPVFTAGLAFLILRERADLPRILGIGLGCVGAYLVTVGPALPSLSAGHTRGNALYLLGVVIECLMGVLAARLGRRSSGIETLRFQILGAGVGYLVMAALAVAPWSLARDPSGWAALAYMITLPGLVAFSAWYMVAERAPLSLMVITVSIQVPIAAGLAWAALGERPGAHVLLGSAIIFAALGVGALSRPSRAEVKPVPTSLDGS